MAGVAATRPSLIKQVAILVVIGVAPDLDLLWGRHNMETHSIGAAALVASVAAWQRWPVAASRTTIWIAVAMAWMSHPILDAMGSDTSVPIGVMALWPFSSTHMQTAWEVFGAISRRYWRDDFMRINGSSMLREVLILGPVLVIVAVARMRNWRN